MRLARGFEGQLVLFGGAKPPNKTMYIYSKGGTYQEWLTTDKPVSAVTVEGKALLIAVGSTIYRAEPGGELQLLTILGTREEITSMVYRPQRRTLG